MAKHPPFRTLISILTCIVIIAGSAAPTGAARVAAGRVPQAQVTQAALLKIVVIEGEDSVNIIDKKTAVSPTVEVRDRNDLPVAGALVLFTIPGGSNTAAFANGARAVTVTTNAAGRATVVKLNPLARGTFQIQAQATYQGQTATATITQTNFATAAEAAQAGRTPSMQSSSGASTGGTAATAGAAGGAGGGLSGLAIAGIAAAAAGGTIATVAYTRREDNEAPSVGGVAASPSNALAAITGVAFTAQVTDPDNDALTLSWDFGDGTTSSDQNPTHIYQSAGSFTVKLTANDGKTSSTGETTVTVRTLTGTWRSAPTPSVFGPVEFVFSFQQSGSSLTGTIPSTPGQGGTFPAGTISGTITTTSPRITFTGSTPPFIPFTFTGDPTDADTITGALNGSGYNNQPITLRRQ